MDVLCDRTFGAEPGLRSGRRRAVLCMLVQSTGHHRQSLALLMARGDLVAHVRGRLSDIVALHSMLYLGWSLLLFHPDLCECASCSILSYDKL